MAYITWHNLHLIPVAIVIALALAGLVLWLYPVQLRTVGRPWRWVMPGLRILALVVLALSILKPVAVRPKTIEEQGAVVILVDRSRSMSVRDISRSPAQLVAIADGLGRLPEGKRDPALPALRREVESLRPIVAEVVRAGSELDYARLTSRDVEAAQQRLDAQVAAYTEAVGNLSKRATTMPAVAELPARLAELSQLPPADAKDAWKADLPAKIDRALAAIDAAQQRADAELHKTDAEVRKVCDELAGLTRLQLVESALTDEQGGLLKAFDPKAPLYGFSVAEDLAPLALRGGEAPVKRLLLEPTGRASDLTAAVRQAMETLRGRPIQAIVLLSDGRQVGGEAAVASGLSASGVPVFTVPVAAPLSRDVAVRRIHIPTGAFVGEMLTVRAEIFGAGVKGSNVEVTLKFDDHAETKQVPFPDDGVQPVEFEVKLEQAGARLLSMSAKAIDGETSIENNESHRWLKVLSDKIRVAAIAHQPGWDFQYIRNALARTPWVKLEDYTLQSAEQKLPFTAEQLKAQDVFILYDVPPACLSDEQWDLIHRSIKDRGGSAILLAGNAAMPGTWSRHVLLSSLLPYRTESLPTWRVWPGEEPSFRIEPTARERDLDLFKLSDNPDEALARWQTLPAMFRHLPLNDLKPNTRPLMIEKESKAAVMTESRLGLGRVIFVGFDETWRWRFKLGERDQDRFWLQVVRYAAEEPYAVQSGGIALGSMEIFSASRPARQIRNCGS
jgi:hypothetical protein